MAESPQARIAQDVEDDFEPDALEAAGDDELTERALAVVPAHALAGVDPGLSNGQKLQLVQKTYGRDLNPQQFYLMITEAQHLGLDVFKREYIGMVRSTKDGKVYTGMVTQNGLRTLGERSGLIEWREGPMWCGEDGKWQEVWLKPTPPAAAKYLIKRADQTKPVPGFAVWKERAQYMGADQTLQVNWAKMPSLMLGKCAESDAYKRSGLISADVASRTAVVEDDGFGGSSVSVQESRGRGDAMRKAHAVAAQSGGHELVRTTVHQLNPNVQSLTHATEAELEQAAELISEFGEKAPTIAGSAEDAAEPEYFDVELADGTTITEREQWQITVRDIFDSQDREAIKSLPELAGDDPAKWHDLIVYGKAKSSLLDAWIKKAHMAGVPQEVTAAAILVRGDAKEIDHYRGESRARDVMPPRGVTSSRDLFSGGDAMGK